MLLLPIVGRALTIAPGVIQLKHSDKNLTFEDVMPKPQGFKTRIRAREGREEPTE
jgi:hypothetical protein